MRNYIKREISIDGRNIPYPVFTAIEYLSEHDGVNIEDDVTNGWKVWFKYENKATIFINRKEV